jgi:hypothetical protein
MKTLDKWQINKKKDSIELTLEQIMHPNPNELNSSPILVGQWEF